MADRFIIPFPTHASIRLSPTLHSQRKTASPTEFQAYIMTSRAGQIGSAPEIPSAREIFVNTPYIFTNTDA